MVLPLVDEDKPKCFLCHDTFDDYEDLRKHQDTAHKDYDLANMGKQKALELLKSQKSKK